MKIDLTPGQKIRLSSSLYAVFFAIVILPRIRELALSEALGIIILGASFIPLCAYIFDEEMYAWEMWAGGGIFFVGFVVMAIVSAMTAL